MGVFSGDREMVSERSRGRPKGTSEGNRKPRLWARARSAAVATSGSSLAMPFCKRKKTGSSAPSPSLERKRKKQRLKTWTRARSQKNSPSQSNNKKGAYQTFELATPTTRKAEIKSQWPNAPGWLLEAILFQWRKSSYWMQCHLSFKLRCQWERGKKHSRITSYTVRQNPNGRGMGRSTFMMSRKLRERYDDDKLN